MHMLGLLLLCVPGALSRQAAHHTGLDSCVYTFNVPRAENTCPPGAMEASAGTEDLKMVMEAQHAQLSEQLHNLTRMMTELSRPQLGGGDDNEDDQEPVFKSGTHYTRWGHAECPSTADLLYTGYAAKSFFNKGGGIDYQCLPLEPEFHPNGAEGHQSQSYIYGVEYEKHNSPLVEQAKHDNNVPCAVCHVNNRGEDIMIPGKLACPAGWTKEYEGLLMAQHHTHHASTFICVDKEMQILPGGYSNQNGGLLYVVEVQCGSLPCPPYRNGFELSCVTCTL